ncbi:MAG: YciI family protein [Rugosibacter sp.]|nr:YciI family protein [Rugosibacter sp.]
MLYVIMAYDAPNSEEPRRTAHAAHMAHVDKIAAAGGQIVLAGPCLAKDSPDRQLAGFFGSLIVAEFDSLAAAQEWSDTDPFVTAGVFESVMVKPFRQVIPKP